MNYLSVCSGIEAATVAWHHMGWNPVAFSEIEKFPSEVLKHHYPHVPNLGDMTKYKEWKLNAPIDILVGGTPCQSFSVAGLRKGLEDPRGNLALTYVGILDKFRPKWFVWENVPGVLSSNGGRDLGSFLGAVVELGYGFSYRVLDSQYIGGSRAVPQRRRRVFVVGCFGDWESSAKVLFEPKSLQRNYKQSRKEGKEIARDVIKCFAGNQSTDITSTLQTTCHDWSKSDGFNMISYAVDICPTITSSGAGFSRAGNSVTEHETYVATQPISFDERNIQFFSNQNFKTVPTLTATDNKGAKSIAFKIRGGCEGGGKGYLGSDEKAFTISTRQDQQIAIGIDTYNAAQSGNIAVTLTASGNSSTNSGPKVMQQIAPTLTTNDPSRSPQASEVTNQIAAVYSSSMAVRRLTPVECERLQGFPDSYTNIKDNCPDGPRYKALGNSMAVPCMKWIGERINKVQTMLN